MHESHKRVILLGIAAALVGSLVVMCTDRIGDRPHGGDPSGSPRTTERRASLERAVLPELRKLAEYERRYGPIFGELMIFSNTPATPEEVGDLAEPIATKLQEFAKYNIRPLVVLQPTGSQTPLDFADYRAGAYDSLLASYFEALRGAGVTDDTIGTWVLFPEANTAAWGNTTDPATIAACVTRTARLLEQYFPDSVATMLLDSKTYPTGDLLWRYGDYASLVPYVDGIPPGLIDSFGLQGFPWSSPGPLPVEQSFDPWRFLNATMAIEAARALGVGKIWFNSGSFSRMYAHDSEQTVTASPHQRKQVLDGVVAQVQTARDAGFEVSLNVFSANKAGTGEATDWSYDRSTADQDIFEALIARLRGQEIHLSIFDSADPR